MDNNHLEIMIEVLENIEPINTIKMDCEVYVTINMLILVYISILEKL